MAANLRQVKAWIGTPGSFSARIPAVSGVVSVPRLHGWASRPLVEMVTLVRGEIIKAVTSNEVRLRDCETSLQSTMADAGQSALSFDRDRALIESCKSWCVTHRSDPIALQALCQNEKAPMDAAVVSMVVEASSTFGEMGRSRVLGALAGRVMKLKEALNSPESVSRVLAAAQQLPWEAPGHEQIAKAVVALDRELFYEATPDAREAFERKLGGALAEVVQEYAAHPRFAVVEEVARACERQDVLAGIAGRAEDVFDLDPRRGYRMVAALASNPHAPHEVLRPFAKSELWTTNVEAGRALAAMLQRAVGDVEPARGQSGSAARELA